MRRRPSLALIVLVALAAVLVLGCLPCAAVTLWAQRTGALQRLLPALRPATAPTPGAAARVAGGELRLAGAEPVTLDPALVQDAYSAVYVVEVFSGLVTLDRDLRVAPDLAERWEISQDGRTYTFHLRPNAEFQDGRAVTADDFRYSLERACSPELASWATATYLGDIEGVDAAMRGEAKEISGLHVLDEHTLSLTIDAPKPYFLDKLTYSTAFVVDRRNVEQGSDWTAHPNGTGPFRLTQRDQDRIVLERNVHYYGGAPALERVTFALSGGVPMTMYENGQLDIVDVGLADIDRVQDPSNPLSRELTVVPQFDLQYLAMNAQVPPFDDVKVRQAFAHAIDRRRLADVVLKQVVTAAEGVLPPGLPGYSADLKGLEFDPELAAKCLQESRYKDAAHLPQIVLSISGEGGTAPQEIGAIADMLRTNLGVEVTIEQAPWDQFLSDLNERRYGLYSAAWIADYPDPQNFLDVLFHSQSNENHMGYRSAEVDGLLEQARVERNDDARLRLYQQAEALIVQDAICVPLSHSRSYTLTKPYVKGAVYSASIRPWLKDVYLER